MASEIKFSIMDAIPVSEKEEKMQARLAYLMLIACMFFAAFQGADAAVSSAMQDFVSKAAAGNQFEISSSQLALKESKNDDVKRFAQQMIDDHKQLGDKMDAALASPPVGMPAPSTNLDPAHQSMLDALTNTPAGQFDHAYANAQVQGHMEAAGLFKDYARNGDNPTLKDFAGQSLPTIQSHLDEAQKLQSSF